VADITGHRLPTWREILDRDYRPWNREHVVIDTAHQSVDECVAVLRKEMARL
jgi:hypothetical protein